MVTLESDKATMDVPAPFAGKVLELKVAVGDKVSEGTVIATMEHAEAAGLASTEEAPVTSALAAGEMESDEQPRSAGSDPVPPQDRKATPRRV